MGAKKGQKRAGCAIFRPQMPQCPKNRNFGIKPIKPRKMPESNLARNGGAFCQAIFPRDTSLVAAAPGALIRFGGEERFKLVQHHGARVMRACAVSVKSGLRQLFWGLFISGSEHFTVIASKSAFWQSPEFMLLPRIAISFVLQTFKFGPYRAAAVKKT